MMNRKKIICIFLLSLLLNACSNNNEDLILFINRVKHQKTREIPPIPSFTLIPVFKRTGYGNERSPFMSVVQKKEVDLSPLNRNRPKEPLEAFHLNALKFVGTLRRGNQVWALIEKPNKEIMYVTSGNYMGQNYGRIVLISNDSLQLVEITKNSGKWEKHKTTIKLYIAK